MKTINLPNPNGIKRLSWLHQAAVASTESPFSFRQQVYAHRGQRRRAGIHIATTTEDQAKKWIATLLKLNGTEKPFFLSDGAGLQGVLARGTPLVQGENQTGRDLVTDGWTISTTVLKAGEWIALGNELHQVMEDVVSDGSGNATLQLWPIINNPWPNDYPIEANTPQGSFRLTKPPTFDWNMEKFMEGFSLSAVEFPHRTREDYQVASFDRASSQRLEHSSESEFTFGLGHFTISLFAKWDVLSDGATIFPAALGKGNTGTGEWELFSDAAGQVSFRLDGTVANTQSVVAGKWVHHVITRSAETVAHYINGISPVLATNGADLNSTKSIEIGCSDSAGTRYFDGLIDCVGLWKGRALDAREVAKLYNGGEGYTYAGLPSSLKTNLEAYWDFDNPLGNLDDPVNGFDLTNISSTTFPDWTE